MMKLIDTDAIKLPEGFFEKVDNVPKFYDWLNSLPPIDAEPVRHARFIPYRSPFTALCSGCKTPLNRSWKYCPDCGAKMDGGGDND